MDYEKKYKEALERAKDYHKQLLDEDNPEWAGEIENIFPELRESEDERIRKAIINTIEDCSPILSPEVQKRMLAWLEKQESKLEWSEEDEHHWMMCLECVKECATQEREDFSKTIDWLKSIKKSNGGINYDR